MGTKRKRIDDNGAVPFLPRDLLEEILLRVPPQCLVKLKSVCKSWRKLIVSKRFLKSYHSIWKHRYGEPHGMERGASRWNPCENRTLCAFLSLHGTGDWKLVSLESGLRRFPSECCNQWRYLGEGRADLSPITEEEGEKIVALLHYRYKLNTGRGLVGVCRFNICKLVGREFRYFEKNLPRRRSRLMVEDWLEKNGRTVMNNWLGIGPARKKMVLKFSGPDN